MNLLLVGDVHGCFFTFKKLVDEIWQPDREFLIQVGDLINKGRYSTEVLRMAFDIQREYPYHSFFLKGNHEYLFVEALKQKNGGAEFDQTLEQLRSADMPIAQAQRWMESRPLKWESPYVLATHAGLAKNCAKPYVESSLRGVLFNRSPLKALDKVQVIGHNVLKGEKALFKTSENAWHIDTGAWMGKKLTALRLSYTGKYLDSFSIDVDRRDLLVTRL